MNGRKWTGKDVWLLMTLAEKVSQKEAARRLNRTTHAVRTKVRSLKIAWRGGFISIYSVCRKVGCALSTVKSTVGMIPGSAIRRTGRGNGKRYMLTQPQADWLEEALRKRLQKNSQQQSAGRLRHQGPHIHTTQPNPAASLSEN